MIYLPELDYGNLIDWNHPETQGLISNYIVLPGHFGGTIWWDIIGTNHGTQTNMAPPSTSTSGRTLQTTRPGGVGEMRFDGTNDYLNVGANNSLMMSTGYTIMASFYPTKTPSAGEVVNDIFTKTASPYTNGYYFAFDKDKKLRILNYGTSQSGTWLISTTALNLSTWYHVAAKYDGATLALYINGSLDASRAETGTVTANTGNATIGTDSALADRFLGGSFDDLRVYNIGLPSQQIQRISLNTALSLPPYLRRLSTVFYSIPAAAAGGGGPLYDAGPLIDGPLYGSGRLVA